MKYIIPIAGKAQRFQDAGCAIPKPLIMVKGKMIIEWAMQSIVLRPDEDELIFIVRLEHIYNFSIDSVLKNLFSDYSVKIIVSSGKCNGAAIDCEAGLCGIPDDEPIVIYTPDVCFYPKFDWKLDIPTNSSGHLLTFKANSPAHSYVEGPTTKASRTAEKQVISNNAAVGVYYFASKILFTSALIHAIRNPNLSCGPLNGEYYICPLYNALIDNKAVVTHNQCDKMYVLGTPQDVSFFEKYVHHQLDGVRNIAICGDHSGFAQKEKAKELLSRTHNVIDFGCYSDKSCDYADYVKEACKAINSGNCQIGFGFCRTGQGVNMCANKQDGIYSALVYSDYTARMSVEHNCANFFSIPSDVELRCLNIILQKSFDGGRHLTRIQKI